MVKSNLRYSAPRNTTKKSNKLIYINLLDFINDYFNKRFRWLIYISLLDTINEYLNPFYCTYVALIGKYACLILRLDYSSDSQPYFNNTHFLEYYSTEYFGRFRYYIF